MKRASRPGRTRSGAKAAGSFQDIILTLQRFWAERGCLIAQPYDLEKGAGTFNPNTFLRCLGPEPWNAAYVEPSRRPRDGRYGDNPNRTQMFHQFQVLLKPCPHDIVDQYLRSLEALGISPTEHDIRFLEDDWESPTLGASGLGWQVWLDGLEITQFTYFQQVGGVELTPISGEITYGLERLAMYMQKADSFWSMEYGAGIGYAEVFRENERQFSRYNFEESDVQLLFQDFERCEREVNRLLGHAAAKGGPGAPEGNQGGEEGPKPLEKQKLVLPAYDFVIKASHAFNLLDARGAISVTQRTGYIARVRALARRTALAWLKLREELGHPLLAERPKGPAKGARP